MRTTFSIIPGRNTIATTSDYLNLDPSQRKVGWVHLRADFTLHEGRPISSAFFDMEGLPYALPPEYRRAVYTYLSAYAKAHGSLHANP